MSSMSTDVDFPKRDPASLTWPATLPVELALRQSSPREICEYYGIDQTQWSRLRADPVFVAEVRDAVEMLRKDGMKFRAKAKLQSEALLQTSWDLIHSPSEKVPPAVKADLIKFTVRAAGLDGSKDQAASAQATAALQINIDLGTTR
jgi:hypothetical protein